MTPANFSVLNSSAIWSSAMWSSAMWNGLAPGLGNHLWQSTLFAAAAGLLTLILRKQHARVRYGLWLAASVKFLIPFSLLVDLGSRLAWLRGSAGAKAGLYVAMEAIGQPFTLPETPMSVTAHSAPATFVPSLLHVLPAIVLATWLCGFAVVLFAWCTRWRRVSTAMREAAPLQQGPEVDALRRQERMAGLRKRIEIVLSHAPLEPGIFGIARPVLIWPEGISEHLHPQHLEAILAHEVWHVRRRDNLAAAIHMVVEALFWFHPLVWWLGARMVEERERACDEEVVELGSERQVYAESILKVCEFCVGSPLACVSGVTGSDLKKRMVNIMSEQIARKLDFGRKLLLSTAGVLALAVPIVFGLANATQIRAQTQDESSTPAYTASVKPGELAKPTYAGGAVRRVGMMYSPDGFSAMNVTLQALIQEAYGVEANQIVGPADLLASAAYDVDVKVANSADNNVDPESHAKEAQRALRAVLEDRFQLKIHRENEQISTYALEVADGGSRLQLAKPAGSYPDAIKGPNGRLLDSSVRLKLEAGQVVGMEARGMSVPDFAQQLSRQFGAPVQDKTGIAGRYDFSLKWTRDASEPGADDGQATYPARSSAVPSLFTAIQEQLGLKLEPQKAPMEILVIDHVARPAEN